LRGTCNLNCGNAVRHRIVLRTRKGLNCLENIRVKGGNVMELQRILNKQLGCSKAAQYVVQ